MSNIFTFLGVWGAIGNWSATAGIPLLPSSSQWSLHSANSYWLNSIVSPSAVMQSNGQLAILYSGPYVLDISVNAASFNYLSGLKVYFTLKSSTSLDGAILCSIYIPGESNTFGTIDTARQVYLNAGDILVPKYVFTDDLPAINLPGPNPLNYISLGFLGQIPPTMTFSSLANGILTTNLLTTVITVQGTTKTNTGQITFFLTNDNTATGVPYISTYYGSFFSATSAVGTSAIGTPLATQIGTISSDLRSISAVVTVGNTINTLLASSIPSNVFAPIGTQVTGFIFCKLA